MYIFHLLNTDKNVGKATHIATMEDTTQPS